jgi:hypothetical protein
MKKVSTAATKQSRNISQQKLIIGLDLGDRNCWYCVVDEAGQIQLEQRVRTSSKALQEVFGAMPRSRIALEIGTHSPWISRLLRELGHEVIVANARKVRLIGESRKKDDRMDAQTLARLARIDPELLYPVKVLGAPSSSLMMSVIVVSVSAWGRCFHFPRISSWQAPRILRRGTPEGPVRKESAARRRRSGALL